MKPPRPAPWPPLCRLAALLPLTVALAGCLTLRPLNKPRPAAQPGAAAAAPLPSPAASGQPRTVGATAALPPASASGPDGQAGADSQAGTEDPKGEERPKGADRPDGPDTPASAAGAAPALEATAAWWSALGDPELPGLIQAALKASPSLASARGRIERARAERTAADAAWMPLVMGSAATTRGRSEPQLPLTHTTSAGTQASWELDLFGAGRAGSAAGEARLAGAEHALEATRISVAADTALSYIGLRACEAQRAIAQQEASSHEATVRVSEGAAEAGYLSSDQAALARAAAAQSRAMLGARSAQCERLLQSLVMLTAIDEAELRLRLAGNTAQMPMPQGAVPDSVPANLIARRPDLKEAAQAVAAAGFDERAAEARRWPTISLQGTIGHARASAGPALFSGQVWSLGPLQVTFPIFDAGVRKAQVQAAQASAEEAQALYQARVRKAAEEVEEALITLRSTRERELNARQAALGFGVALAAAERRLQGGMASVLEVETTRRAATAAKAAVIELQQARVNAWVTLYRVLGGSWG